MRRKCLVSVFLAVAVLVGVVLGGSLLKGQVKTSSAVPNELTSYRDVVKTVLPAVVSIERRFKPLARSQSSGPHKHAPQMPQFFKGFALPGAPNNPLPEEMRKFLEEFGKQPFRMPETPRQHGFGSGFILSPQGVIVTNHHVVEGADEVQVELRDGRKFTSKEIKSDPKTDLAVIRIETKEPLPYLTFGDSLAASRFIVS